MPVVIRQPLATDLEGETRPRDRHNDRPTVVRSAAPPTGHGWAFAHTPVHRVQSIVKRAIDLVVAWALLLLTLPLFAVIAIAVRLDSPGPIFFGQTRVGRDLRLFRIWKFRSMREGAEAERPKVDPQSHKSFPLFKLVDDPRATRVGRVLRRWSLDELPQLWNVVRGEMSLVGPRPPLPEEVAVDGLRQSLRMRARPGLTGPWQVNGRCELPYADGVALDLAYVRNWSLATDLGILVRTPWAIANRRGAY